MPIKRHHILSVCGASLFVTGAFACNSNLDDDNFREDVFHCEQAVAHAEDCCPGLRAPSNACVFFHDKTSSDCGCSGGSSSSETWINPVVNIAESDGIVQTSCEVLNCADLEARLSVENQKTVSTTCGSGSSHESFRT